MYSSVSLVSGSRRSVWPLLGWTCLFTVLGAPLHELGHALIYYLKGIDFTMTINRVIPDTMTVAGELAGPVVTLMAAWFGIWLLIAGKFNATAVYGFVLGQLLTRPPLHIAMLFFGLRENDENLAANLLDVHQAVVILPAFILFVGSLVFAIRHMRSRGYPYWYVGPAFAAVVAGIFTVVYSEILLFDI